LWGNGAVFDNTILGNAYFITGRKPPWNPWDDRCYRTVKALFKWIPADERQGTYHNALDDAMHQTKHLIKILGS
jgi:exodeoxyribonuclease VIII